MSDKDWNSLTTEEKIVEILKNPMMNGNENLEKLTEMVKKESKFYYKFLRNEIKNNSYQYPFNSFRDFKKFEKENPKVVYFQALWEYQRLALNWTVKRKKRADNQKLQRILQLSPIKNEMMDVVDDIVQMGLYVYAVILNNVSITKNFKNLEINRFSKWELNTLIQLGDLSSRQLVSYISIRHPEIYQNYANSVNPSLPEILNELIGVKFKVNPRYENQNLKKYFENLVNPEDSISYEKYKMLESVEKHYGETFYFPRSPDEIVDVLPYVDDLFKNRKYQMSSFDYEGDIVFEKLCLKSNEVRAFFMALGVKQLMAYLIEKKTNNPELIMDNYLEYIKSLNSVMLETAIEALKRNGIKKACEKDVMFYNWRLTMEYSQLRNGLRKVLLTHLKKMKGDTIGKRFSQLGEFDLKEKEYVQKNDFHQLWKKYNLNLEAKNKNKLFNSLYNSYSEEYIYDIVSEMVSKLKLEKAIKLFKKWGVDRKYWQALEDDFLMRKELASVNTISSGLPPKIRKF